MSVPADRPIRDGLASPDGQSRWVRWGMRAYVVLVPVMVLQGVPWFGSKLQWSDVMFLLPLAGWLAHVRQYRSALTWTPLAGALAAWIGVAAVSALVSASVATSAVEVVAFLYMGLLYLVMIHAAGTWDDLLTLADVWLVTSTVVALLGIAGVVLGVAGMATPWALRYEHLFSIRHPLWILTSTFRAPAAPNMACGYLQLGGLLALGMLCHPWRRAHRAWYAVSSVLHLAALALTFSRGWIACVLSVFVFLWQFRAAWAAVLRYGLFLGWLVLVVAVECISVYQISDVRISMTDTGARTSSAGDQRYVYYLQPGVPVQQWRAEATVLPLVRPSLRRAAVEMARERPWLGVGPGNFAREIYERQAQRGESWGGLRVTAPWDPHSTYFGGLAEQGWLGMAALACVLWIAVWQAAQAVRRAAGGPHSPLAWALLACVVGYLVLGVNEDLLTKRWFWCAVALAGSAYAVSRPRADGVRGVA